MKMKNFSIKEFVPKTTYDVFGEKSVWFMDNRLLLTMQFLREVYGKPITVNNWSFARPGQKVFQFRGLRPPTCTIGATYSQHRYGRACDFDVHGMTAQEVREDILKNQDKEGYQFIQAIEMDVTWVHIDLRTSGREFANNKIMEIHV